MDTLNQLTDLQKIIGGLRRYSLLLLIALTTYLLSILVIAFIEIWHANTFNRSIKFIFYFLSYLSSLFGLAILYRYVNLKKKGNFLYEKLALNSDHYEFDKSHEEILKSTIKSFLRSTDVPFIKGDIGVTIYFLLYVEFIVLTTILWMKR